MYYLTIISICITPKYQYQIGRYFSVSVEHYLQYTARGTFKGCVLLFIIVTHTYTGNNKILKFLIGPHKRLLQHLSLLYKMLQNTGK